MTKTISVPATEQQSERLKIMQLVHPSERYTTFHLDKYNVLFLKIIEELSAKTAYM